MENKENIMQLQMIEQEVNQLGQQLQIIEQNISEIQQLNLGLEDLQNSDKKEILAGIGKGIYIPAEIKERTLLVEIGNKSLVKKSIEETKMIIKEQLEKMISFRLKIIERIKDLENQMRELIK
jgi:prefoldin alpha subunit